MGDLAMVGRWERAVSGRGCDVALRGSLRSVDVRPDPVDELASSLDPPSGRDVEVEHPGDQVPVVVEEGPGPHVLDPSHRPIVAPHAGAPQLLEPKEDGRTTVRRPESAARYAANALLYHEPMLLAAAAVLFSRSEVEALLARTKETTDGE